MNSYQSPELNGKAQLPTIMDHVKRVRMEAVRLRDDARGVGVKSRNKLIRLLKICKQNPGQIGEGSRMQAMREMQRLNNCVLHPMPIGYEHLDFYSLGYDNLEELRMPPSVIDEIRRDMQREIKYNTIANWHNRNGEQSLEEHWDELEDTLQNTYEMVPQYPAEPVDFVTTDGEERWDNLEDQLTNTCRS